MTTFDWKEGTKKFYTYQKESIVGGLTHFTAEEIAKARRYAIATPPTDLDPRIEALVHDLIGRVADKWTMMVLEVLAEHGELRFTRLSELVGGISQKMLTQTLRHMERDGLLVRTVFPVVPPKVEYRLTGLGLSLGSAFCGVWVWAAENLHQVDQARQAFDGKAV
ncbi:winged helix-turn-helix transcriptional regulator [Acidisoma cellulosilyticum]|uniref:winged helix-turn-helix transcriptional regulator n=1 Tax=Acidisoma cellulosilyticum TaxID=2802395 RepID=UPI001D0BB6AF|nr:helix-turn-helix domain-containing protein [Acidisoma cellulosilyticum]